MRSPEYGFLNSRYNEIKCLVACRRVNTFIGAAGVQSVRRFAFGTAWLILLVATTFLPPWDIPDSTLQYLTIGTTAAFPVAVIFSGFFDHAERGIVRTLSARANLALRCNQCLLPTAGGQTVDPV